MSHDELLAENSALRARISELEAACRCGARALRMYREDSETAVVLEACGDGKSVKGT